MQGLGFRVFYTYRFRVAGSGFRVLGFFIPTRLGFRVQGLGFRVFYTYRFRVSGSGFRV